MTETKTGPERRVALPVDPTRRTEIDKQRVPMAAKPYRLLALVKQDAVVRVQKEPDDTVLTWPHLLAIEFFAAAMMSVFALVPGLPILPFLLSMSSTRCLMRRSLSPSESTWNGATPTRKRRTIT